MGRVNIPRPAFACAIFVMLLSNMRTHLTVMLAITSSYSFGGL